MVDMAAPHTPQKRKKPSIDASTAPIPATPPTSPLRSSPTTIPNPVQEVWNTREAERRNQLFSLSRPTSSTRLSHGLSTGLLVQEDFAFRNPHQMSAAAIAQQQPYSVATWGYMNAQGTVMSKGLFKDETGKDFPYELEVVFASDILSVLWQFLGRQEGRLNKGRVVNAVAMR